MVRRRSTVRFRNGAPTHTLERWRPTWADQVRHFCVVRLATADTGSQRLAVPNTCPSLSRALRVRSCYASPTVSAGSHSRRAPFAGRWANGHPRYVHAGAGMLAVAAAVGTDDFPRCRHGRWRRGRHAARVLPPRSVRRGRWLSGWLRTSRTGCSGASGTARACECCVHSAGIEPGISRWAAMCRLSSTCRALSLCVAGRRAAGTRPLAVRSASMSG